MISWRSKRRSSWRVGWGACMMIWENVLLVNQVEDFQGWILLLALHLSEKPWLLILMLGVQTYFTTVAFNSKVKGKVNRELRIIAWIGMRFGLNKTGLQTHFEGKVDRALRMIVFKAMEISVWVRLIHPSRTRLGQSFLHPYSRVSGQEELLLGHLGEVLDYPMTSLKNYDCSLCTNTPSIALLNWSSHDFLGIYHQDLRPIVRFDNIKNCFHTNTSWCHQSAVSE